MNGLIVDTLPKNVFGRLTVISLSPLRTASGNKRYNCNCECGSQVVVSRSNLVSGCSQSCGCRQKELAAKRVTTHGKVSSREYKIWSGIINRCTNSKSKSYSRYGGRGITVCERWRIFENFLADMGPRPSPKHSVDRFPDNDGPYSPENCRWATHVEQSNNKRTNRLLVHNGLSKTMATLAKEHGLTTFQLYQRLKHGWTVERAVSTPIRRIKCGG